MVFGNLFFAIMVYTCTAVGASCTGKYIFWPNHAQEDKWKSEVCSTPFKAENNVLGASHSFDF